MYLVLRVNPDFMDRLKRSSYENKLLFASDDCLSVPESVPKSLVKIAWVDTFGTFEGDFNCDDTLEFVNN